MFELLSDEQHYDFAVIGYLFAARTLNSQQESNLAWLKERGRHMDDFFSESPAYQWILDKGEAQGVAQMRQTIVDFMRERLSRASPTSRRSSGNHRQSATAGRLSIKPVVPRMQNRHVRPLAACAVKSQPWLQPCSSNFLRWSSMKPICQCYGQVRAARPAVQLLASQQ